MTLLHMDGFELGDYLLRYAPVPSNGSTAAVGGRTAYGRAFQGSTSSATLTVNVPAGATMVSGQALIASGSSPSVRFLGDAGSVTHVTVQFNSTTGAIDVYRGTTSGTLLTSLASAITPGQWFYAEVKVYAHDSAGNVKVRLNGASTNAIDWTGQTTNGGTNDTIDQVTILTGSTSVYVDDWYILDTNGSVNNDFLGEVRVYTLAPNGNGNYSQLTGSDGNSTDNYLLVDEQPYATADYVGSATTGQKDSYALADIPASGVTVHAVQEVLIAAKSDAGAATAKHLLRRASTDYTTAAENLGASYAPMLNIREQDPSTSAAWTPADINATEIGLEVG